MFAASVRGHAAAHARPSEGLSRTTRLASKPTSAGAWRDHPSLRTTWRWVVGVRSLAFATADIERVLFDPTLPDRADARLV